jgi:hypothetical protein
MFLLLGTNLAAMQGRFKSHGANTTTDACGVCQLDSFCEWVLKSFRHFRSFCWCLFAPKVPYLQLTLDCPWNVDAIQKLLSGFNKSLRKHFKGIGSGFTDLHTKLDADMLQPCGTASFPPLLILFRRGKYNNSRGTLQYHLVMRSVLMCLTEVCIGK